MARKKKEKYITVFDQKVKVDEFGVIDWNSVKIPQLKIPKGSNINDLIVDINPRLIKNGGLGLSFPLQKY